MAAAATRALLEMAAADRWGISWQITPRALLDAITDSDPKAAKRAFDAMMTMQKVDIATIEAARRGR